ncbi:hypothetical protein MCOR27_002464 [Pyricularia oryzae]|nr:hypothetical protein MCOR01_002594 [Pyricularia oryzae]KAI6285096.1 hypothetical protein MCOR27_002464 [Pyricularia oryzae]KAI6314290.1 hypothetical protein MCOR30_010019 [Pyricularia oryzae]KAI6362597.1 hypothetical protein MCOR31_008167 [Pyricularia oryzae]KAI6410887.1 hypothetical protein MCOR23_000373 [Pyricularia oryzae]
MASRATFGSPARLVRTSSLVSNLFTTGQPLTRPARNLFYVAKPRATAEHCQRRLFSSNIDSSSATSISRTTTGSNNDNAEELTSMKAEEVVVEEAFVEETIIEETRTQDGTISPEAEAESALESEDPDATPWYLEVEPPRHPTLVPHDIPLPPTPADSPALVGPLIKFVAEDLGVDDFNVLDLRTVEPPPALGPKLIMMFGTARSERHLHVSADRLVRWLRGHGVTAHADGLLGRNELKTKMRRRARKAKLMGDTAWDKGDDGISTGWICVNLGTIGWKPMAPEDEVVRTDAEGRITGFGTPIEGTTLVVQLMTEGKREELGLERLWNGVLKKSDRDRAEIAAAQNVEDVPYFPPHIKRGKRGRRA